MTITRWVQQTRLMQIVPYRIANTNDLLTGRGGLVCVAELLRPKSMGSDSIDLANRQNAP